MAYKLTGAAEADLIAIYVHGVRQFGPTQADRYHAGLTGCFLLLAENPYGARERAEFMPPVRLHAYQSHIVAYKVMQDDDILIIRIIHGRANWQRIVFDN